MRERPSVRRMALGAAAALALGGAAFLVMGRSSPPPEPGASASLAPVDSKPPGAGPRRVTVRVERSVPEDWPAIPAPLALASSTANEYRERARFPRWSQPIRDGVDPILRDRQVTPGRSMGPDGENPRLVVRSQRVSFESPSPVVIFAELDQADTRVRPRELRGEVRTQEGTVVAELEFRDDGRGADARSADRIYTAALLPEAESVPPLKGAYLVDVDATTEDGELRNATTGFLYSVPGAHLTGHYRDVLRDGNLVVEAQLSVENPGRFHLEVTLGAADGTPIAWAQQAVELPAGNAWVPLTFYGLILREARRSGPYVLRSVALSTTTEMPNQKNNVVVDAYRTGNYRPSDFTDRPFNDPDLLEAAERLEHGAGINPARLEVGAP